MLGRRKKQALAHDGPGDAQVSASMAGLADAFVTVSSEEGFPFDFAVENAPRLDAMVDLFLRSEPTDDAVHSMVLSMGAYVGELIVRHGGGRWTHVPEAGGGAGVQLPSGLVCFPPNKVGKRITLGPTHSIAEFVEVVMSGDPPPGALRRVRAPRNSG